MVSGRIEQQFSQQIAIDQNNDTHIVEDNKTTTGDGLEHFIKQGNTWVGQYIDTCFALGFPKLLFNKNKLYCVYGKTWEIEKEVYSDLFFTKYDIITNIKEVAKQSTELKTYPNPGSGIISIEFENSSRQLVDLSVYDFNGKLVSVLAHRMLPPGMQRFVWEAHTTTGQKVKPGIYLVKLTAGDSSATQVVEIIK